MAQIVKVAVIQLHPKVRGSEPHFIADNSRRVN